MFEYLRSLISGKVGSPAGFEPPPEWQPPPENTDRLGVCCSGGGVRSASYNLGALQALQEEGVLERAEYLSAVSGGGYIAGAMTMVAASPDQSAVWGDNPKPFSPRSPEETYLRNRSSYLAPTAGLKIKLISRVLLGFAVNAAFIGSAIVIVGRALGYLAGAVEPALVGNTREISLRPWTEPSWRGVVLLVTLGVAAAGLGLILQTVILRLPSRRENRFVSVGKVCLGFAALSFTLFALVPSVLAGARSLVTSELPVVGQPVAEVVVDVDDGISDEPETERDEVAVVREEQAKGSSALARLYALLAALGVPVMIAGALRAVVKAKASKLAVASAVFVAPALISFGVLVAANDAARSGPDMWRTDFWPQFAWIVIPLMVLLVLYFLSDLTASSMHPFYKRRLSTAFALERISCDPPDAGRVAARERDYDLQVSLSEMRPSGGKWPTLICCAAANISDVARTPPGRKAVTFTFEPERVGGPEVGYMPTKYYAQVLGPTRSEDITLPAAMAMSGAALSPSMGAMTRPTLTFLLALLNARLGVWLPNPHLAMQLHREEAMRTASPSALLPEDEELVVPAWKRPKPRYSWIWRELLGMNSGDARFLYVTDGGHWENLGLVELLRRGCTKIYCFDAAGDKQETFFTIGEAISLARSELGVEIRLKPDDMRAKKGSKYASKDHVKGSFRYPGPQGRTGVVVFCKAAVTRDAPWDVRAYKERDPAFPNHSLMAQMFADKTFESYRRLGYHTASKAIETMEG